MIDDGCNNVGLGEDEVIGERGGGRLEQGAPRLDGIKVQLGCSVEVVAGYISYPFGLIWLVFQQPSLKKKSGITRSFEIPLNMLLVSVIVCRFPPGHSYCVSPSLLPLAPSFVAPSLPFKTNNGCHQAPDWIRYNSPTYLQRAVFIRPATTPPEIDRRLLR